jgi:peptidoglycan/LPS O-acetylase OafA/YrhL
MSITRDVQREPTGAQTAQAERTFLGMPLVSAATDGYRRDIDGLRAIAVAVVVIFHTGVSPLRGGFVGVDIFFVISGFLITGLLVRDVQHKRFSLAQFYERRIRRILPAMLFMVFAVLVAFPFILFHPEMRLTASTAIASLFSAANIYLLTTAGYFEADAATQPFLHMWSLGVEEQFYLVFPLAILALQGARWKWVPAAILGLLVTSLGLSVVVTAVDRDFAYFFPLTRAWELLIGAALVVQPIPRLPRILREIIALGCMVLILASAWRFHSGLAFPGWVAIIPCAAAAGLIALGSQGGSLINRFLALAPVVFLGQISYSLYLWHWPVFVGYRLLNGGAMSALEAVLLVGLSIGLATISWRFIEGPFRTKQIMPDRRRLFASAAAGSLTLVAAAGVLLFAVRPSLAPNNEADRLAAYIAYDDTPVYRRGTCFLLGHVNRLSDYRADLCRTPVADRQNILVIGDSHAAHLWSGLQAALPDAHVMQATSTGCKPVIGTRGEKTCIALIDETFAQIGNGLKPDVVVLSARWIDSDLEALRATIAMLAGQGTRVVVSGPIVEYGVALPRLLAQVAGGRNPDLLIRGRVEGTRDIDAHVRAAVEDSQATYFSPYRLLCARSEDACSTTNSAGVPLQWDYGHLTKEGSALVGSELVSQTAIKKP